MNYEKINTQLIKLSDKLYGKYEALNPGGSIKDRPVKYILDHMDLNKDDTILYSSCFDANGGLFETILGEEDAVFSDELNHASIIDGIRLCKAQKYRYKNCDMNDLQEKLSNSDARVKLIVTDGVFSMDGTIAPVDLIVQLAKKFNALVMVDDCHATGFIGANGKGSGEHCGVLDEVDIISSTFGKALGGASGGFISASKNIVNMVRWMNLLIITHFYIKVFFLYLQVLPLDMF